SRRRHTRLVSDWSSDVCSSDLATTAAPPPLIRGGGAAVVAPQGESRAENNHREREEPQGAREPHGCLRIEVGCRSAGNRCPCRRSEERRVGKECGWGGSTWVGG